jgi:multidrug efflux system membrane fusion protein
VHDNQFVRQGDLLFEIDPSSYRLAVDKAEVALQQARDEVASLEASVRVAEAQYEGAKVGVTSAEKNISAVEASVQSAQAAVEQAKAGITTAEQLIKQRHAELDNARSEATRAKRLVEKRAGSTEDAESTAATSLAKEAQLASAQAGLIQSQAALTQAEAGLNEANVNLLLARDGLRQAQAAETSAKASLDQAKATLGAEGDENVRVRTAQVTLDQAKLDLSYTTIIAPSNGHISNLSVDPGTYAVVGQALVALVDSDSFRVHAYFQETKLRHIQSGDPAIVTLMSHPDTEIQGVVDSVGSAVNPPNIAPTEGQAGEVPQIQPTFDWIRLPQRVPVRIRLTEVPEGVQLISGATASVAVRPSAKE